MLGRLLGFYAIFLQIAVFLQPLLPEKYQVSPVCETITQILLQDHHSTSPLHNHHHIAAQHDTAHEHQVFSAEVKTSASHHHHHDANHQCQYCVVYSHVLPLPDVDLKQILVRIQVRFLAFIENYLHVFFQLQQLFLTPQGRAPPLLLSF
ncbi:DUF2946 family protein [Acinetobacter genomosp. 15BJ]|uniref:DUF2946 domain-containing protein n=1 Tax=Acinetobacter genomosp. 15BJ TaxID=106651 RepID=R9B5J6_9GAMM|nr:DUF2946 family protein [Acinetobacter genomosp. 15BJ]EOR07656.1 hypothetical protein F896_02029 [Acinetobacter genomosp. 15BJ]MCH7292218.1 DUF2946 domain-containing protein [Acinetobacter genomosp. 15BJ]MDO3656147.1 DUF2946 domain-containing protein [Acinetobacter genomosp. 15BJ]